MTYFFPTVLSLEDAELTFDSFPGYNGSLVQIKGSHSTIYVHLTTHELSRISVETAAIAEVIEKENRKDLDSPKDII